MSGEYADQVEDFHVIDCRYPYEFEGGHIEVSLELDCTPLRINGLACGHGGQVSHRGSQNPYPFYVVCGLVCVCGLGLM